MPGCRFHVARPPIFGQEPPDPDLSVLPVPPAAYTAPALTPIEPGSARYPIAHALALLVRAREHCPAELAGEITAFVTAPAAATEPAPPPAAADTGELELPEDDDDLPAFTDPPPALEAFGRMPGFGSHERRQTGPVMAQPPPPAPSFTMPAAPRRHASPPYSNGCAHPGFRLAPNGHGMTCLDCSTDFPGFTTRSL